LANVKNIQGIAKEFNVIEALEIKHVSGICSASFVNHAQLEKSGENGSGKLFPMLEGTTQ
jgi:hypothetical protein